MKLVMKENIIDSINRALNFLSEDEKGVCLKGLFIGLIGFLPRENREIELAIRRNFDYIHQDIWNLSAIFHRLEWFRQQVGDDPKRFMNNWIMFTRLDIDHFHIEFRSIFDYFTNCIALISRKPATIKSKSWQKLLNWLDKNKTNEDRLGKHLCPLVRSAEWVLDIIEIRDGIVHYGGDSLVFSNPKEHGILFQCYLGKNHKPKVDLSIVMFNEHVARFELYSALFFSYLLCFLDDFATIFNMEIKPNIIGSNARSYSPGFCVVKKWMEDLKKKIGTEN